MADVSCVRVVEGKVSDFDDDGAAFSVLRRRRRSSACSFGCAGFRFDLCAGTEMRGGGVGVGVGVLPRCTATER